MKKLDKPTSIQTNQIHPFPPLYNAESRVLILGSFPSVKSREQQFYYGHPQNRFWKVIAAVFGQPVPSSIEEKKALILSSRLALWDTIASCDIVGSSDSSIRNVKVNDLAGIMSGSSIRHIITNGGTSYALYQRYQQPLTGIEAVRLPSTSPANAAWDLERLIQAWGILGSWI